MKMYLIRGLPGSGKSTFAKTLADLTDAVHCEADNFLVNEDGEYKWDATLVYESHLWCKMLARESMIDGRTVIVSNTSTTEKELRPYLDLAEEYGYQVTTLIVENRHGNASIHGVPEETMTKMRNRFSVKL